MPQAEHPDIESSSEGYARRFSGEVGELLLEAQATSLARLLSRMRAPRSALEVGGGHAQLTAQLLKHCGQLTVQGSDQRCKKRLLPFIERFPEQLSFVEAPIPGILPFHNESFELVVAIRLLAHIDDWRGFIGELCRLSSGAVVIDFAPLFGANILTPLVFQLKRAAERNTRPYLCQWDHQVRRAFSAHGFRTIAIERELTVPMGVHRALKNPSLSRTLERHLAPLRQLVGGPALLLAVSERSQRPS